MVTVREDGMIMLGIVPLGEFSSDADRLVEAELAFTYKGIALTKNVNFKLKVSEDYLQQLLFEGKHYDKLIDRLQSNIDDKLNEIALDDEINTSGAALAYQKYISTCINARIKTEDPKYLDLAISKYNEGQANETIISGWHLHITKQYLEKEVIIKMAAAGIYPPNFWLDALKEKYSFGLTDVEGNMRFEEFKEQLHDIVKDAIDKNADKMRAEENKKDECAVSV